MVSKLQFQTPCKAKCFTRRLGAEKGVFSSMQPQVYIKRVKRNMKMVEIAGGER